MVERDKPEDEGLACPRLIQCLEVLCRSVVGLHMQHSVNR